MGAGALLAGSRAQGPGPSFISTSGASPVSLTPSLMTAMRRRWSPIAHPQLPSDQQRAEEYEGGLFSAEKTRSAYRSFSERKSMLDGGEVLIQL